MGSLFKFKNSNKWWIRIHRPGQGSGKNDRIPTGTEDKAAAKAMLAKMEGDLASGIPVNPKVHTILFAHLCELVLEDYENQEFKTFKHTKGRILNHIIPYFRTVLATAITSGMIDAYFTHRRKQEAKPATIRRELEIIKRAFTLGWKRYRIPGPEVELPKIQNARQGFFEQADFSKVLAELADPDYRDFIFFLYVTGWRTGEVKNLRRRHVHFVESEIRLDPGTTKNGDPRCFPMQDLPVLRGMLERRLKTPGFADDHVFTYKLRGKRRPIGDFQKAFNTACYKAGIPCVTEPWSYKEPKSGKTFSGIRVLKSSRTLHDFRRSAARNADNAGVPRTLIMDNMGHKTEAMFIRYRIGSKTDREIASEKLGAAYSSLPDPADVGKEMGKVSKVAKKKAFRISGG